MSRLEALTLKVKEYPYKTLALKLSGTDFDVIVDFIEENEELGHLEFEYKVNRMFLDKPEKPKKFAIIQELLMVANTRALGNGHEK